MSDPVVIAVIGCVGTVTAAVVAVVGIIINKKLNAISVIVDGRLQQLLDSQAKGARAEGNLEGRAELREETKRIP